MGNCLKTQLTAVVNNPNLPYFTFHSITKALLGDFNVVVDESNTLQKAVDDFVRTLNSAGLWGNDKINALCLPFLTSLSSNPNLNDAVLNCINTEQTFFDATYTQKLELVRNGLVTLRNGSTPTLKMNNTVYNWATNSDLFGAVYLLEDEPIEYTSEEQTTAVSKCIIKPTPLLALWINNVSLYATAGNRAYGDSNYSNKSCMLMFGYNPNYNGSKAIIYVNGQSALTDAEYSGGTMADWGYGKYYSPYLTPNEYADANNGQIKSPVGLISVGKYLTPAEVGIYNNAANSLITAVKAYFS